MFDALGPAFLRREHELHVQSTPAGMLTPFRRACSPTRPGRHEIIAARSGRARGSVDGRDRHPGAVVEGDGLRRRLLAARRRREFSVLGVALTWPGVGTNPMSVTPPSLVFISPPPAVAGPGR